MKKGVLTVLFFVLGAVLLFAQLPTGINYQAVARNTDGTIIENSALDIRIGIYQGQEPGTLIWQEEHSVTTSGAGIFSIIIGGDGGTRTGGTLDQFTDVDWSAGDFSLESSIDLRDGNGFQVMGRSPVLAVPYAYYAGSVGDLSSLKVLGASNENPDSALFEVKRSDGQTVFAVYPEGVRVYVDTSAAKGPRGGFAIGGFGATKGEGYELFRVTPDSVRIYLDPLSTKGPRGGFAIGGYGATKGITQDLMRVTQDSVRLYIDDRNLKGPRGGFAIGGFGAAKSTGSQYFNVSGNTSVDIVNPSEPRIMWFPKKEAFLSGRVLIESPDSIGQNSLAIGYESKAVGDWSVALGYQSISRGQNSMAMGNAAVANSLNSFAFGNGALALNDGAYAFGAGAQALGMGSIALGGPGMGPSGTPNSTPTQATGDYSFAFGLGAQSGGIGSIALGTSNHSGGMFSIALGFATTATGYASTAIGFSTSATGSRSLAAGSYSTAEGFCSMAMGESASAISDYSLAYGNGATASGLNSYAFGVNTVANGDNSFAFGPNTEAAGYQAVSFGGQALGDYSMALGVGTKATAFGALILGQFNDDVLLDGAPAILPNAWQETDPVFVVGNGIGGIPNNALILYKNGTMIISGSLTQNSDARLKKNIVPLSPALNKIEKIQPVTFEYKNTQMHPSGTHIGFLAQDIEPLFPELITKDTKGFLSVDYPAMTAVLMQAIREQQEMIITLQGELEKMKQKDKELAAMKEELAEIRKMLDYTTQK